VHPLWRATNLRILILHNRYQQPGGEDIGVRDEHNLLMERGHQVKLVEESNDHIHGLIPKLRTALTAAYSRSSRRKISSILLQFRPDVVHVHNFFPVLTPSVYFACNAMNIPVVQTLHNYRLLCPRATFFRDGEVCERCLGRAFAWPGVVRACYRDSHIGTAAVANISFLHRMIGTFHRRVARMILLSEFSRQKFIEAGFPSEKLVVKPCFIDRDPGFGDGEGGYALFVGRLTEEKGLHTLLKAWRDLGRRIPLYIAGGGPLETYARKAAEQIPGVKYLGYQNRNSLNGLTRSAAALIFPSLWFEGMPRTIIEAFACGTPVICSRIGSMATLVKHMRTGLHFDTGDADDLIRQVNWMSSHSREWDELRRLARLEYEREYTPDINYVSLMNIYKGVLGVRSSNRLGSEMLDRIEGPTATNPTEVQGIS
jgi:glycosyltransferase involved in cell wall biosynthesis